METKIKFIIIAISVFLSGCRAEGNVFDLQINEGDTVYIDRHLYLNEKELVLPNNVTLVFEKGGRFSNGIIRGQNTQIEGYKESIFEHVLISGIWNVKYIDSSMFIDKANSLQSIIAMTSPVVDNVVVIGEGDYVVSATLEKEHILSIPSNTEVIINGSIRLKPNQLSRCDIFYLKGENISIHGKGLIEGDKHNHLGKEGEWGMGIRFDGCDSGKVFDITIKDCWGDCIYIGGKSSNIEINNCTLDNGRRQGISVTSAKKVLIKNCVISNVYGTLPEYAIDIEPNSSDTIEDVRIENVHSINCHGGILAWGDAKKSWIRNIVLTDCYVEGTKRALPYYFKTVDTVYMKNCHSDKKVKPRIVRCKEFHY